MRTKALYIILLSSVLLAGWQSLDAKKPAQPAAVIPVEREQQFKYYWYAAKQAIDEERYADAYALLEFCSALNPEDGQTLYYLGVLYQGLGKQDLAVETFEKAYRVQAKGTAGEDLLEQLKRIYINRENWEKAIQMQDEIDARTGYDAMSAITRYRIYAMWEKPKKAIEAIDRYLETDPTNVRFMLFRLELLERTKAKKEVLYAQYEQILELDPHNLLVLNNYAYLLATHKGDLKKAERMSGITIREEPGNPVYLDTYGWILHLQGQDGLALIYLKKALWNANDATKEEIQKHIKEIEN